MKLLTIISDTLDNERAIVLEAASRLSRLLQTADGPAWTCEVRPVQALEDALGAPAAAIYIMSLAEGLVLPLPPWDGVAAAVRARIKRLSARGPKVVLLTIFRHVASGDDPELEQDILVRIRRLNLLAIELSNEFGISVADLDRDLADVGALCLATDFRLGGDAAKGLAGWALTRCIITNALDGAVDFDLQDQVMQALQSDRPTIEGVDHDPFTTPTRVGRKRRRSQTVYVTPGAPDRSATLLIAGALQGRVPFSEIRNRLHKGVRERRLMEFFRLFMRELVSMAARKRA